MDQDWTREEAAQEKGEALRKEMADWEKRALAPETPFIDRQATRDQGQEEKEAPTKEPPRFRRSQTFRERDEDRKR